MAKKKHKVRLEALRGMESAKDRREALETLLSAFPNPKVRMRSHMLRSLWKGPTFDPEHTRVAVADGRVASVVVMAPRMMRFGPARVPAMTVGPVGTHAEYRKLGLGAAAMDDSSKYMKDNGYLIAYLQGIGNFYHKYGYYPYAAPGGVDVKLENAERESLPGRLKRMTGMDIPRVRKIFDKATAGRICAADRDRAVWTWLLGPGVRTWIFSDPMLILDGRGRLCGYMTINTPDGSWGIRECVVRDDERAFRVALGAAAREARRRKADAISLPLMWDDPMAVFIRQYVSCRHSVTGNSNSGWMLKIVDFPALMKTLEPLFTERWEKARSAVRSARFTLKCEMGSVCFAVARGRVKTGGPVRGTRVVIPQRWLTGLVTGYHGVAAAAAGRGSKIPASVRPALDILFPFGWPYTFRGDNY